MLSRDAAVKSRTVMGRQPIAAYRLGCDVGRCDLAWVDVDGVNHARSGTRLDIDR
jgi:hypothetical protein